MPHAPFDLVIYHANCLDGFAAAWAAHKHSPDAECIPATYGDDPPDVEGKRVLIVDFSYPRDVLLRMKYRDPEQFDMTPVAADLVIFDHHKTAAEDLRNFTGAVFDMKRSGAGITWDVLISPSTDNRARLIDYVEDRDLWRFRFPETKAYIAALSTLPFDFAAWDDFAALSVADVSARGEAILAYQRKLCESLASRAYVAWFRDVGRGLVGRGLAFNSPPELVSDTADYLKPRADGRAIVGWFFDGERGDFVFSLRSAEDGPDVSEIARAFGGGGHEHAAGFRLGHNPLVKS